MGKKNGTPKVKAEKKARKVRDKMRSRKDSAAGHYADRLAANDKQRADILKAVSGYPGVDPTVSTVHDVIATLNRLASDGFVPARKRSGRSAFVFVAGQQVSLQPEAIEMLKFAFPALGVDTAEFFVSNGYTPQPKDSQLPLRVISGDLNSPTVGFVSRKWIQTAAPQSA